MYCFVLNPGNPAKYIVSIGFQLPFLFSYPINELCLFQYRLSSSHHWYLSQDRLISKPLSFHPEFQALELVSSWTTVGLFLHSDYVVFAIFISMYMCIRTLFWCAEVFCSCSFLKSEGQLVNAQPEKIIEW